MLINTKRLKHECRDYGQVKIAQHLGVTPSTLSIKLADPTNRLYVREFFGICELLGDDPMFYIQKGDVI